MNSTDSLQVGVAIPCYNEADRLDPAACVDALTEYSNLTLLFVDDGSTDTTREVIEQICERGDERASALCLATNVGKGEAVRQGMLSLTRRGTCDIVGFWDADLAVPLQEIPDFVALFKAPYIKGVIGSRIHLSGRNIERIKFRHYLGRIFATVISLTFDLLYYDTQCGAKLFRTETIRPVIEQPFSSRWIFDVEMLIRISSLAAPDESTVVYEFPVRQWTNVAGTKRSLSTYFIAFADYLRLIKTYIFDDQRI